MEDWIFGPLVCALAAALLSVSATAPRTRDLVWMGLGAHLVAAIAQVLVTRGYYGSGDMIGYFELGRGLSQLMQLDPGTYVPEVGRYILQQAVSLPVGQRYEGSSTASMTGLSAFIVMLTGESLHAACLLVGALAFFGKLMVCRVLWERMDARYHRLIAGAVLLVPSAVFWSAGLLKESLSIPALCMMVHGGYRAYRGHLVRGLFGAAAAGVLLALLKPYLLFPLGCAMAVWLYFTLAQHGDRTHVVAVRPTVVVPAALSAVAVVVLLGRVFPEYSADRLADEAAQYQEVGTWVPGGSSFELGDPRARSVQAQIAFVPLALANVLFRPMIFEARNPMLAVNALETTALLVLFLTVLYRRRWREIVASVLSNPELAFCLVLVLTMGVGVGLTTTNLGTLSRYRMPMMPFFALLLLVLAERRERLEPRALAFPGPSRSLLEHAQARRRGPP